VVGNGSFAFSTHLGALLDAYNCIPLMPAGGTVFIALHPQTKTLVAARPNHNTVDTMTRCNGLSAHYSAKQRLPDFLQLQNILSYQYGQMVMAHTDATMH
jgi:hypothetical protein